MDGFNFEDVEWGELNLLDNEIMSSTDAIEEWGIKSSTLRKRINDFPKGSIRKIGTTYAVTRFGMRCVCGSNKKVSKNKLGEVAFDEESHKEF